MDIDSMSIEEQKKLMQDRKRFHCKKSEHISKDCPLKKEKEIFWKESEDSVMENCVNVSFSILNYSFCNSRTREMKYTIYSNQDLNTEE
jgi:hypothetical protein